MVSAVFETVFFLNGYLHVLAVALLAIGAGIAFFMALLAERRKGDAEKRVYSIYPRLRKTMIGLTLFAIAGAMVRSVSPEWAMAAASGKLESLTMKYELLFLFFLIGLFLWMAAEKRIQGVDGRTLFLNIEKGLFRFLGSKGLSLGLLLAGVGYFFYLTIMWFINIRPPMEYMVWFPVMAIVILFLINILISLFTRPYAYNGNILFHAAFVILFIGVGIGFLYRFEGRALLMDGDVFWGEKEEYTDYYAARGIPGLRGLKNLVGTASEDDFDRSAPRVSFKLDKIVPEYWRGQLHFTRLDAEIRYPAETMEKKGVIRLNGGPIISGARIRHTSFGFAPEILFEDLESGFIRKQAAVMAVFPPGHEDYLELGSYKLYIQLFSDPVSEKGKIKNKSMNLVEPVFLVKVTWLGRELYKGALRQGDKIVVGRMRISFSGVKYWLQIEVVKEPAEMLILAGLVILVLGLLLRLLPMWGVYKGQRTE